MLLMSPAVSRPQSKTLETIASELSKTGFWPASAKEDQDLLWMDLKGFFADIGEHKHALRIGTCYADGTCAKDIAARNANRYSHWRVETRHFSSRKRDA